MSRRIPGGERSVLSQGSVVVEGFVGSLVSKGQK